MLIMATFDYQTLKEKHLVFKYSGIKTITTEAEFMSFFADEFRKKSGFSKSSIFRGVGEAKWKIISSCQRAFISGKVFGNDQSDFINREIKHIKEIQGSLLPKYYHELGVPVTDFLYLSFLQHYGAPTTLIDFSKNCKTALWMAANNIQYHVTSENDIDNYFSIYWIDKKGQAIIPSILEKYQKSYLSHIFIETKDHTANRPRVSYTLNSELLDVIKTKKLVLEDALKFISWNNGEQDSNLANIGLGIIYTSNVSQYDRRYSLVQIEDEMFDKVKILSKNLSESAVKVFKNIVFYLFNEVVRIANLNLVAQDGCFIHYLPKSYETPLEEYETMKGIIHCVDIHKSLAPCVLKVLAQYGINRSTMYPDTIDMAKSAFLNAQAQKK